jgi:23S rRNA (guanosine2251-2'-O)-methyltransferase
MNIMEIKRNETGKTRWYYGRRAAVEILKSGQMVRKILLAAGTEEKFVAEISVRARAKGVPLQRVPAAEISALVSGNHQGIALLVSSAPATDLKTFVAQLDPLIHPYICLLDEIQDPGNLGAIIRSAACFDCGGVVIPKWRAAGMNETVMKASSGAASHISVVEVSNLGVTIERVKEKGYSVYGADMAGEPIDKIEFNFPIAIVMGNEHRGIKPILKNACDRLISIPQTNAVASLNVSNAAAVIFYEISKALRAKSLSGSV